MSETDVRPAALVTGAARRIGRAIAADLARHGHPVAIHANRSREAAGALAAELAAETGVATAVVIADLADPAAVVRIVPEAEAAVGPIGLLVNNASVYESDAAETVEADFFQRHMTVNALAPALLARDMAARLPDGAAGLVVNLIDQRVWKPTPQAFSYSASKAALWWMTRTMAQAFAPRVRVVGVAPGPTLASERQDGDGFARQVAATPLGRQPDLAEFGRTVRFALSTPSLTGQMIALDGGQHLAWATPDVVDVGED